MNMAQYFKKVESGAAAKYSGAGNDSHSNNALYSDVQKSKNI